jgi:ATP-dependent DNA ligase
VKTQGVDIAVADSDLMERLIVSPDYVMQEKIDGMRLTVEIDEQGIRGWNKRGAQAIISPWLHEELSALPRTPWKFDGEYATGGYYIFDLLDAPIASLGEKPFIERIDILRVMMDTWEVEKVHIVETWITPKEKLKGLLQLALSGKEGAVFRPRKATTNYVGQVYKYKFRNTVDGVVISKTENKASVEVGVYRNNELVSIGKCPASGVKVGDVVEVSYRRLSDNHRLIEPVFSRVRDDKLPYSCVWGQLDEGKHLQDQALLDRQANTIARSLNMDEADLHELTTTL